ncbi:MAG: choice-of-anchor D domain-containing protein [Bacteroidota bacterium]|nr:choice-of-anchor D domain-containing protein [Candidatus Kapabacteria bacterium]MDW8221072.1 choice-of-anchor D domain-containing protein [Bacteroidota bacterium]
MPCVYTLHVFRYISCALCAYFCVLSSVWSQGISVLGVSAAQFPRVRAQFYAIDSAGRLVTSINSGTTTILEGSTTRRILSISCPTPPPPRPLSVVLTIDVSGSMASVGSSGISTMAIVQRAARTLINAMSLGTPSSTLPGGSECAVTSFDHDNYLNQDWTTDRARLLRAIESLQPQGGTDYDAGFLNRPAGGIEIARTGKYRRILLFFTDGIGSGSETAIIRAAQQHNVRIFVVCFGLPAPLLLRNVAQATGGFVLDRISTDEETRQAFLTVLLAAQDTPPCEVVWESEHPSYTCETSGAVQRQAQILVSGTAFGLAAERLIEGSGTYVLAAPIQPQLVINPPSVGFTITQAQLGIPQTRTVTITARNGDYRIFTILSSDTNFRVTPTQFALANNTSQTLTISYTARQAGFAVAAFSIIADTCPASFYAVARTTIPPVRPTLVLTFPNGGQRFVAGADTIITWRGIAPDDSVRLEYSTDSGRTWNLIVERASGLQYRWERIPFTPSERCLIRITQLVASPDPDTVITLPGLASRAGFVVQGERVAAAFDGQVTFWDSFTTAFYGGQVRHRSAIRSLDVSPNGSQLASADDGGTIVIWDTQQSQLRTAIVGNVGNTVRYTPDGTILAIAGATLNDNPAIGLLQFYDATTAELVREIRYTAVGGRPRELFFSPNGRIIGMVRSDGGLSFWDVQTGISISAPLGSSRDVNGAVFSSDGNELFLATRTGCERWDWQRGLLIRRFALGQNVVSVHLSPNGQRVITAALTHGVSIWDARGVNACIRTLNFPNQEATYAEFHPDSRRFLTISNAVIRVHALAEPIPLQADISDSLWAIVAPAAEARDIDMRTSFVGVPKDSVIQAFIRNTGTYPVRLDSVYFTGAHPEDFAVTVGVPAYIPVGASHSLEFRFRPRVEGERTARVNVMLQHTTLQHTIRGEGIRPSLQISVPILDFGNVLIGTRRDTVLQLALRNTGTTSISITTLQLGGPDNVQFSIVSAFSPFTLAPGESRSLTLRFAPTSVGRAQGSVIILYNNGTRATLRLFGTGVDVLPSPPCTLRLYDTVARPNDRICLSLAQVCSAPLELSTSVTVLVSFNATLLFPEAPTPLGIVADGIRYIPLTLNLRPVSSTASIQQLDVSRLQNICFTAMLGNTTSTRIALEVLQPVGAPLQTTSSNLRLLTSQAGGTHLFFSSPSPLRILTMQPNPASDRIIIQYTIATTGTMTLNILDVFGRTLRTQALSVTATGTQEVSLSLDNIPAGTYFVRLSTSTHSATQRFSIVR